ncbi:Guanylate kinase [subsurface metagenome]
MENKLHEQVVGRLVGVSKLKTKMYSNGKLIIFSAPSGAGKTTIVKHLLHQNLNLEFSISACSRQKREKETEGKNYYFLTVEEFKEKLKNNEFVEWEEVYKDHFYGTLKSELNRIWEKGKHVIFDVDVVGGLNLKNQYKDQALAIFILPPSLKELEKRLNKRLTDSSENIKHRLAKAEKEMKYAEKFDKIIINKNLNQAYKEAIRVVKEFINS